MRKKVAWLLGGSVLLVLCLLAGAFFAGPLIASAQSTTPGANSAATSNACQLYQQTLANSLHVSTTTLHQDQIAAREAVIAQEVKSGQLTQAQADTLDKQLTSHAACSSKKQGLGGIELTILRQALKAEQTTLLDQIAPNLHLTTAQLQSDLQQGQTLLQIAKAQKVTASQLHTIVLNAADTAIAQAQKAGTITATQASEFTTYLKNHPGVINHWLNHHFAKK